jgi:hypothetical protein
MTITQEILCLVVAVVAVIAIGALDEWHQRRRDRQQIKRWRWPAPTNRSN